jgi:hypothetical protein
MSDLIVIGYPMSRRQRGSGARWPGCSGEDLIDLQDAAVIRRDRTGKLHVRTSLPPGLEQRLMEVLHGADPAAATWEQPRGSAPASG